MHAAFLPFWLGEGLTEGPVGRWKQQLLSGGGADGDIAPYLPPQFVLGHSRLYLRPAVKAQRRPPRPVPVLWLEPCQQRTQLGCWLLQCSSRPSGNYHGRLNESLAINGIWVAGRHSIVFTGPCTCGCMAEISPITLSPSFLRDC